MNDRYTAAFRLGVRLEQLARGEWPLLPFKEDESDLDIASREQKAGLLRFIHVSTSTGL